MALSFGTSGVRGLVAEFTSGTVSRWVRAYLEACPPDGALFVGYDLRASSPAIAEAVMATAEAAGIDVVDCGILPTPALALLAAGQAAVMVTGSHIPADRNGLKFYHAAGEITKADEARISAAFEVGASPAPGAGQRRAADAVAPYRARYLEAFGSNALAGLRLGVYEHSSVARDVLGEVLAGLGAEVMRLARSDVFIPVDTEAVDPDTRAMLAGWCRDHGLDAVVSTDGDGDRPMLTDETGAVIPGDVLGVLTAQMLGAEVVVTPVSTNTMVTSGLFDRVELTRIGSPFVVATMDAVLTDNPQARVVGFEANGGFLLGFEAQGPAGPLAALPTRDAILPIVAPLALARRQSLGLTGLRSRLPARFTAADRLQNIDREKAGALIARLSASAEGRAVFFAELGAIGSIDETDGLRLVFETGPIVHFRLSGNAPEFRIYGEAETEPAAQALVVAMMAQVDTALR
jgi:phosphomannomutase